MAVIEARLWGDPFSATPRSRALRRTLLEAERHEIACSLALTAVKLRPPSTSGHGTVSLDDGCGGEMLVSADLTAQELAAIRTAARGCAVATAPLVVFGTDADLTQAGLEFAQACAVLAGDPVPAITFARVRAAHDASGREEGGVLGDASLLAAAAALPASDESDHVVVLADDPWAHGLDLAAEALAALQQEQAVRVTVATCAASAPRARQILARRGLVGSVVADTWCLATLQDASAVVMPWRESPAPAQLAVMLAAGRPVVASRNAASAAALVDGCCYPVGGRSVGGSHGPRQSGEASVHEAEPGCRDAHAGAGRARAPHFEPDPTHLLVQIRRALTEPELSREVARRGRAHALTHLRGPRPTLPAPAAGTGRASVVLEAPLFELSSSSLLTVATARALIARDQVDVFVVPRGPHHAEVDRLARCAPDVLARCVRQPPADVDLWLASGWPPRADRPRQARTFGVRLDWEYGALPVALAPLVPSEADVVVVHSHAVEAMVASTGRRRDTIALVPHGVDAAVFRPEAPPLREVLEFKGARTAILFTGGLIWRKGIDVLLNALLQMPSALRAQICLVIKPMGAQTSYRGFELGELVHRFQRVGAVETTILDRDLDVAEMAGLYTACDVYAQPYRGEGFGLPVLEALACGLPAVVTAGGSTDDFAWGSGCLRVAASHRVMDLPEPCLARPWVLEPDVRSLGAALARAVRERSELAREARASAPMVALRSSWTIAAAQLEALATHARARGSVIRPAGARRIEPVPVGV